MNCFSKETVQEDLVVHVAKAIGGAHGTYIFTDFEDTTLASTVQVLGCNH